MTKNDILQSIDDAMDGLNSGQLPLDAFFDRMYELDSDWTAIVDLDDEVEVRDAKPIGAAYVKWLDKPSEPTAGVDFTQNHEADEVEPNVHTDIKLKRFKERLTELRSKQADLGISKVH